MFFIQNFDFWSPKGSDDGDIFITITRFVDGYPDTPYPYRLRDVSDSEMRFYLCDKIFSDPEDTLVVSQFLGFQWYVPIMNVSRTNLMALIRQIKEGVAPSTLLKTK